MPSQTNQYLLSNIIIIADVLAALILVFVLIYNTLVESDKSISPEMERRAMSLTSPVGRLRTDSPVAVPSAPEESATIGDTANNSNEPTPGIDGQAIYQRVCFACHGTGLPTVPQLGAADDWSNRIAQGNDVLYERAISGYTGDSGMVMPARGGNPALTDDEVRAAVDYLVSNSR